MSLELSIDGILGLIGLVYNNADAYSSNSEQLQELFKKVKLFEIPLHQLKIYPEISAGISAHIQNLYIVMKEIQIYLSKHKEKNKVQNFLTALIVEKEIKKFNLRLDEIRTCINFELDVSNHFIFHSFNQKTSDFNSQMECLVEEMKSKNMSDMKYWSCILEQMIENKISCYMEKYDEKIYLLENCKFDEKLYLLEQNIQNQILYLHDLIHNSKILMQVKPKLMQDDIEMTSDNVHSKKKKTKLSKENNLMSEISKYANLVIEYNSNMILKNHFKMILLIYLLRDNAGNYFFDGQSIIKKKSCADVFEFKIKIPDNIKTYNILVPEEFIDVFLYKKGFVLFIIQTGDFDISKIPFEIKEFYNMCT